MLINFTFIKYCITHWTPLHCIMSSLFEQRVLRMKTAWWIHNDLHIFTLHNYFTASQEQTSESEWTVVCTWEASHHQWNFIKLWVTLQILTTERAVGDGERMFDLLQRWGQHRPEVRFFLRHNRAPSREQGKCLFTAATSHSLDLPELGVVHDVVRTRTVFVEGIWCRPHSL